MSLTIKVEGSHLVVADLDDVIQGRFRNQLNFWDYKYQPSSKSYSSPPGEIHSTLERLTTYLARNQLQFELSQEVIASQQANAQLVGNFRGAFKRGSEVKAGRLKKHRPANFVSFLKSSIKRKLKSHQIKAALHLLAVGNGANFSVPGSGKTTVVLTVFHWLKHLNQVDALFVVGPPSCFGPWRNEFKVVLGRDAKIALLAGGDIVERRTKYAVGKGAVCDLYLTSFQTLIRDWERVKSLFAERGLRFYFVVDEAHYIKQVDGAWATAVLNVAQFASYRCILTGTPFPRSLTDAFNLFDALWCECPPLTQSDRAKLEIDIKRHDDSAAVSSLRRTIGPLFYRVRKRDLGLAKQEFHEATIIQMGQYERMAYDAVLDQLRLLSKEDYARNVDLLARLKRGRMMRMRQCLSYAKLLSSSVDDYNENLLAENLALSDVIMHYDSLEKPAKLIALIQMVKSLRRKKMKVLIWSNFVMTLKLIAHNLDREGHRVRLIYGETPTETSNVQEELTREKIIAEFIDQGSGIDVLVANPAACAESISLHKTCSHAIYYDLSYNCAQYLQSLDRIHRVGGSENKVAHYYFLQYANTLEADILSNVRGKARNMNAIIDQDYPVYSMDMFTEDEELDAYERIFK
jgi:SNF2 family DNA or RNA helicase